MPFSVKLLQEMDRLGPDVKTVMFELLAEIEKNREESITKKDFLEFERKTDINFQRVWKVLEELAEAQKRTDLKVEHLAEAQRRTELRVEQLAQKVEQLAEAQRRTELRVEQLAQKIEQLAESQKKTQEEIERLDKSIQRLCEAQKNTEYEFRKFGRHFDMKLGAFGARWGYDSEGAFREAVKHILQDTGFRVEHYQGTDKEGSVFGRPEQIELDLIVKNGKVLVAEIKSSVNRADISVFEKKVRHYVKETKREVTDKTIISPFIDPRGSQALADAFNIKLITNPEDVC